MIRREMLLAVVLLLLLTGCGSGEEAEVRPEAEEPPVVVQTLEPNFSPIVAPVEGETLSPDGAWRVRLVGVNEGITASGLYAAESVQVVDTKDGTVMWADDGYYNHAALWSEDGAYLALALTARSWCEVTVIETGGWTAWDVTLPDGGGIPEYTFLPEDWGEWLDEHTLCLTVGRGGDAGEQRVYRVSLSVQADVLTGVSEELE